ncbi:helix-turn-helix domain-containing protein [Streptomyces youssoufiensis]
MSTEAVSWAMDDAPMLRTTSGKADATARHVLQALAEHANKQGRNAHPSVTRLQYRTGYDRRTVQRALRRLEDAGLILRDGTVQDRTRYRLAMHLTRPATDWEELEKAEEADRAATAERVRKHRAARSKSKEVTQPECVTETHSDDVTRGDVTHSASVRNALEVRDVTQSECVRNALNAALTTNQPPGEPPSTPVAGVGGHSAGPGAAPPNAPIDDDGFALTDAMRRWAAATFPALDADYETEQFLSHFRADGARRRNWPEEWKKWLRRSAKYASERATRPPLRAVNGSGWQPYQNPIDPSAYTNGW